MYSYHAWIVLAAKDDTAEADRKFDRDLKRLEVLAQDRLTLHGRQAVVGVNFSHVFQCSGQHNHRRNNHNSLMEVLRWVSTELPGSWGLVYWQDDEMQDDEAASRYHVIVMRKGIIEESEDTFLSPLHSRVEWQHGEDGIAIDTPTSDAAE